MGLHETRKAPRGRRGERGCTGRHLRPEELLRVAAEPRETRGGGERS